MTESLIDELLVEDRLLQKEIIHNGMRHWQLKEHIEESLEKAKKYDELVKEFQDEQVSLFTTIIQYRDLKKELSELKSGLEEIIKNHVCYLASGCYCGKIKELLEKVSKK